MAFYGYARVSTLDQDLTIQRASCPIWSPAESFDRSATRRSWTMRAEMQFWFFCYLTPKY